MSERPLPELIAEWEESSRLVSQFRSTERLQDEIMPRLVPAYRAAVSSLEGAAKQNSKLMDKVAQLEQDLKAAQEQDRSP